MSAGEELREKYSSFQPLSHGHITRSVHIDVPDRLEGRPKPAEHDVQPAEEDEHTCGGESAAASDGEGCVDDDALAAERASAFGISISGCKRGKVMGLCAYPEGSGACPVTCGTCGQ